MDEAHFLPGLALTLDPWPKERQFIFSNCPSKRNYNPGLRKLVCNVDFFTKRPDAIPDQVFYVKSNKLRNAAGGCLSVIMSHLDKIYNLCVS